MARGGIANVRAVVNSLVSKLGIFNFLLIREVGWVVVEVIWRAAGGGSLGFVFCSQDEKRNLSFWLYQSVTLSEAEGSPGR